jgi:cell surface protein SprA
LINKFTKYSVVGVIIALLSIVVGSKAKNNFYNPTPLVEADEVYVAVDTPITPVTLPYPYTDQSAQDPLNYPNSGGLMLNNPSNVNTDVQYDPVSGQYIINQKMGGMDYRPPTYMEADEYQDYAFKKQVKNYWNARSHAETKNAQTNTAIPKLNVGGVIFDRIFGGNTVDIRPNGSAELIFAYNGSKTENPALPVKQRKIKTFDFNEKIQLNVIGKIGDKLKLTTSYNTEATFDFENQMKLEYTGYEDEIIKKIEAGNVSMPLTGSLITGSQTLFGIKTQLQFGRLTLTNILSQQKGKKSEVEVTGGAQVSKFEIAGDAYEANKHFFLAQYFRDQYNTALQNLPFVNSGVNINRIEVWVSNSNNATTDIRSIVGFSELAEDSTHIPSDQTGVSGFIHDYTADNLPKNDQNNLYSKVSTDPAVRTINTTVTRIAALTNGAMVQATNFELLNAKKLQASEYTLNAKLGFISLNQQLNPDQVLCVAYQYTYQGQIYQVGEFSDGGITAPQALFAKMLKSTTTNTRHPMWDLMMKNIYSVGSYQINPQDFKLDVLYMNAATGTNINYLPVPASETRIISKPLIQVLSLDKLNQQNDHTPDGVFDFIDGVTINANNGRVIFPVVEPFGDYLRYKFFDLAEANKYVFDELYDSTKTGAQQHPDKNRYRLRGTYKSSSSSEISLGAPNVPQGSVTVTAGGVKLTENVDYTVDYTLGRVKIINDGILNSGTPIKISLESNALFAIQSKTLLGTHFDFKINKDFNIGGTILNLTERPLTKKINIGDEPVSNTIWGLDGNYRTEAPFLTRWIDKIPFIETKEMSTITAAAEYAYLIPGHSKAIGKSGNSYIDDFEGSQSTIDLRSQGAWNLASTPQGQTTTLFPEGGIDSLPYGYNRAKLSWYVIDPLFLRQTSNLTPSNYNNTDMSNNAVREVPETEVFPNKQSPSGQPINIATLDLAYYPSERGPYNYDTHPTAVSAGLNTNGTLKNPESRWGGIMRAVQTNDFEAANIEYIQFWVMDPFNADNINPSNTGDLYFNIGNVSEDVLRDSYKSAENGLPAPSTQPSNGGLNVPTQETPWGIVPTVQPLVNAFNAPEGDRTSQDVGLDGLSDAAEQSFFSNYLTEVHAVAPNAPADFTNDPSGDDFHYFRGDDFDAASTKTLERYKKWNGMEGNSKTTQSSSYPTSATTIPNVEDVNHDNNLSTIESYFQYHISLKPSDFSSVGSNYITNIYNTTGQNIKDGTVKPIKWYQFKIPLKSPEARIGTIDNFQSIRFVRMFMKNVDKPIVLRFARLELVRDEWRKYGFDLLTPGIYVPNDDNSTLFDVAAVNIEENGSKQPVNYVLPPGIDREINAASANLIKQNEQSMSLTVCNLDDGQSRAAYKNTDLDVRSYKKLKMYIHAEASADLSNPLRGNDLHAFIRLGTDFTDNYYEYEIPMQVTAPGSYNGTNEDDQYRVWPEANEMVLEFEKLQAAKTNRNVDIVKGITTLGAEYKTSDGSRTIIIKGNPNLSAIKTIMIGVRNPKRGGANDSDDGLPKCGQVWVNELRLTDFDQKGGWAANARVTAKLADFGTLSLSGNMYTPGFGSIENKVAERKKETLKQYDISSSLELAKFLPQEYNIHIPMYVGYSETFITPQYNPLDPDILLKNTFGSPDIPQNVKDSIKHITQDYTKRRSINFTNVKKDKGKGSKKNHIYDVENWAASYSYSELFKRNVNIEYNFLKDYRGGVIYNFSPTPKNIKPFAKVAFLQSKYLTLIKDINFYLMPNKLGFSTDVDRQFSTSKSRNTTGGDVIIIPTFNKHFTWNRNYDFKYDITKGLKLDFTAVNQARILEPDGAIDSKEKKDSIKKNFMELGKTTQYNHQFNLNYTIPINKIPLLDFTSASVRYTGTYSWVRAPFNADSLGNIISNSKSISWNGQLNMITLYNKIPYFKKINQKGNGASAKNKNDKTPPPKNGKDSKTPVDSTKKDNQYQILEYVARIIMSVKNVTVTYATIDGTILPGYARSTQMMGMDNQFAGPTPGFILGSQQDIRGRAIATTEDANGNNDWLVKTQSLNTPYVRTNSQNLNIRANVEPLPDLKIEVTAMRTKSKNNNEFFRWRVHDSIAPGTYEDRFVKESPSETGNFSMSFLSYRTSFVKDGENTFQKFLDDRSSISERLGAKNKNSNGAFGAYAEGYNATSQEVLIPAFIAAYSGKNPNTVTVGANSAFPKIPKPNWRITYDGLSKMEKIKKYFKSFTLSHAYRSSYNVGGYTSNLLFVSDGSGYTAVREAVSSIANNPNFLSDKLINSVTITEQWSPLIKLDATLNNSILISFEFKKDRNLSLGLTSKTITELNGREIIGGTGYRLRDLKLGNLKIKGKPVKSDLNLKVDLSFRKNQTVMRRIVEEVSQSTAGTNIISIKVSADYVINERISIRLFYDRIINKPIISSSFPTTNTNAGVSLRLTLSN